MSDTCNCYDEKQTKTIYCDNCEVSSERLMTRHERMGPCMLHMMSVDGRNAFICPTCKSKGFYLQEIKDSFPTDYNVKKKNALLNFLVNLFR